MSLLLMNLDEKTRECMLKELEMDMNKGSLYLSPRLSNKGRQDYPLLLKQAITSYDDSKLAQEIRSSRRLNETEIRNTRNGTTTAKVPITAAETLAEGEFNRFYIRGLCVRAQEEGVVEVVIYRAKAVSSPRSESQAKIGAKANVNSLLTDLRSNQGVDTALGIPAGPNSGLSVKLP
jgi:hypothetical protein